MTTSPSALQKCNNDLISTLSSLSEKRSVLSRKIAQDQQSHASLTSQVSNLSSQLSAVSKRLENDLKIMGEYDAIIREAEDAYGKIVDSSRNLLEVVRKQGEAVGSNNRF